MLLFALAWICTDCIQTRKVVKSVHLGGEKAKPQQETGYYVHTVRWPGETLSAISKWYTGRLKNWKVLAKANPELNPQRIIVGRKIRIPEYLLKTRKPMPKEFVDGLLPKPKQESIPPRPSPAPPSEGKKPELFGPKR